MEFGELLTRWTVRGALALYLLALTLRLLGDRRVAWMRWARWAWSGGFVAFVLHMVGAFHFFHDWSHQAAYEATAQQTAAQTGLLWGGGLYANYAFALVWGADLAWWWRDAGRYLRRSWRVEWAVQGFLAFIAFNSTVVFASGPIRWLGAVASVGLGLLLAIRLLRPRPPRRSVTQ